MEKPCLNVKDIFPDDTVLKNHLGETKNVWDEFNDILKKDYPHLSMEWRYYNDGKSWLCKILKKKKTICWVSVFKNFFKTGFYFPLRAEEFIKKSSLNKEYVDQFVNGKSHGKIKGITVNISKSSDLGTTKILIDLKEKFK